MRRRYPENISDAWSSEPNLDELWAATALLDVDAPFAIERLSALADKGSALSMFYIGDALLFGHWGQDKNEREGECWLNRAYDCGSVEAGYRLANFYRGCGSFEKAHVILENLVEKRFAPAMYIMGNIYYRGEGVAQSVTLAMDYWLMAEKNGHLLARQWVSLLLRQGVSGYFGRIVGYVKYLIGIAPLVYYTMTFPESDRLRNW